MSAAPAKPQPWRSLADAGRNEQFDTEIVGTENAEVEIRFIRREQSPMGIADELQQLEELRDRGTLTAAEFATAKAAVLAGKSAPEHANVDSPAHCFRCSSPSHRACTLCGKLFCLAHGGERFVWVSETGDTQGLRNTLTKRTICDDCTPDATTMKRNLVVAGIFAAVVIGVMLYILTRPMGI